MKRILLVVSVSTFLYACKSKSNTDKAVELQTVKQVTIDSMQKVMTKKRTVDSIRTIENQRTALSTPASEKVSSTENTKQEVATPKKKKGWSPVAKGAAIGAGTGAMAGAIIDKKHGEGALIGGVLGAGAGAATGAIIKKNKKKKLQKSN